MKRELTGAKDELADVCSHVEAAANPHRSKKGQNKPAHNNYFEGFSHVGNELPYAFYIVQETY